MWGSFAYYRINVSAINGGLYCIARDVQLINTSPTVQQAVIISSIDTTAPGYNGITTFGDNLSATILNGQDINFAISGANRLAITINGLLFYNRFPIISDVNISKANFYLDGNSFSAYQNGQTVTIGATTNPQNNKLKVVGDVNAAQFINTDQNFRVGGTPGITTNFTIMNDNNLPCDMNFKGGILIATTC